MLTRHLYRYDEVRAALLWCVVNKRTSEGLFWTQELLDSGCHTELFQILFEAWIWSVGVTRFEWFRQYWILYEKPDIDEEELLGLVNTLFRIPERDSSVLYMLLKAPFKQLDRLPPTPKTDVYLSRVQEFINTPLKQNFVRYLRLGKANSAWTVACKLIQEDGEDAFWDLLSRIEITTQGCPSARLCFEGFRGVCKSVHPDDPSINLACQAAAVGFLCLSSKAQTKSCTALPAYQIDSITAKAQEEWKALEGRRKRRIYAPPSDCLSWLTSRGCNPYTKTTIKEVRNLSINVLREKGCPFWQDKLDEYDPWKDDDVFMDFWDHLFPDDIPDEWSLEDQKKSHGSGVLRPDESPMVSKLIHKWFFRIPSVLIWNTSSSTETKKLCDHPCWKDLKVWTTGYEAGHILSEEALECPPQAKGIRFEILS